jgi:phenylpropionate dioxygenase-like ring-hydroxylating dioxygenase large terminal subunit
MLSKEHNDLVTQTGPGTPGGDLFRRYWQPVALAEELPPGGAPKPVRLLGEDLVLYRGKSGAPCLMELYCPHRGTDLIYGRIEGDALRCLYHGWLLDKDGRCLEQPGEPAGSNFKSRIRHPAYPCREAGGLILAYLGPGEAPPLPRLPIFAALRERVWVTKLLHECNYLQGNEGNVDPQHLSVLHRMTSPSTAADERMKQVDMLLGADLAPDLDTEETPFGFRIFATRSLGAQKYVRVSNFIMPNCSAFDGGPLHDPAKVRPKPNIGYWMHWHVPIDDRRHWKYAIVHCYDAPVDADYQRRSFESEMGPGYDTLRRRENRYLQDRAEMERLTWLGMGYSFYVHDRFAVESQGPIVNRSREHLGVSDRAVILMRRQLLEAIRDIEAGRDPPMTGRGAGVDPLRDLVVVSQNVPAESDTLAVWREHRPAAAAE